ncbi:MAG: hypothetical protein ACOH2V_07180 [Candidatus Saccharimonadaceae bacterium]
MTNKVIAQVVNVGKQYKTSDTVITDFQPADPTRLMPFDKRVVYLNDEMVSD